MMKVLAPVDNIRFDIEDALEKQSFAVPLPFTGMDSKLTHHHDPTDPSEAPLTIV